MNSPSILFTLKARGQRLTVARRGLISILEKAGHPLSAELLWAALAKSGLAVSKTTVYREIEFLLKEDIIRSVHLDDYTKHYELAVLHHHHVVCMNCSKLVDVETEEIETYLEKLEKKFAKKINFKTVRHSLEFFGECGNCQKKKS